MGKKKRDMDKQLPVFSKLEQFGDFSLPGGETKPAADHKAQAELLPWTTGAPPGNHSPEADPKEDGAQFLEGPGLPENALAQPPVAPLLGGIQPVGVRPPLGLKFNSFGMSFALVPAGTFLMGSPEQEFGRVPDETQHEVTISQDFYLQTTPVTQGQAQAILNNDPNIAYRGSTLPLTGVNWMDCMKLIAKLNARGEGTYRLPTEAEWEYACRAGTSSALPNGELRTLYCNLDPNLAKVAWYCGNSGLGPQAVAQKWPNPLGLYDMLGNVAEWCQDWYGSYPDTPLTDPQNSRVGPGRVLRGGSWFSFARNCRSAARFHWPPQSRNQLETMGLRLVLIV